MDSMVTDELREAWQRAVDEVIAEDEAAGLTGDLSQGPESDDAIVITRTKIYAGKCNSLLSYVHGD